MYEINCKELLETGPSEKSIEQLLKYMDSKHHIKDILCNYQDCGSYGVLSNGNKMLVIFFKTIVNVYLKHGRTPTESYSDDSVTNDEKCKIMDNVSANRTFAIRMYNTIDYMYLIIKNVLKKIVKGFVKLKSCGEKMILTLENSVRPDLDLLFYIVFYNSFSPVLKRCLKQNLKILSDVETKIFEKCSRGYIVSETKETNERSEHYAICNVSDKNSEDIRSEMKCVDSVIDTFTRYISKDTDNTKQVSLSDPVGVYLLVKLFLNLRNFASRKF